MAHYTKEITVLQKRKGTLILSQFLCFLIIVLSIVWYFYHIYEIVQHELTFDDAYMFIRYADNFLNGYGFTWNANSVQTYGTTSLLYLLLIIILRGILTSVADSSLLISVSITMAWLAIIVLISVAHFASSDYIQKRGKHKYLYLAGMLLPVIATSKLFIYHSTTGMDTTLSLLCNSLLIISTLTWICHNKKYAIFLTLWCAYLAYLTRPDNLIYTCLFPILCIIFLSQERRKKNLIYFLFGLLVVLSFDSLLKIIIFGDPLPLPFYAKTNGYYEGYSAAYKCNPITNLFEFFRYIAPFLVIMFVFISKNSFKIIVSFITPIIITFVYYFSVLQIMGKAARFYFPSLPFFIVSSFLIIDNHSKEREKEENRNSNQMSFIHLIIIFFAVFFASNVNFQHTIEKLYEYWFLSSPKIYLPSAKYATVSSRPPLPSLGWWKTIQEFSEIAVRLPKGTRIALSEYGFIGAKASNIHIIDPLGLHDPFFAHNGFSSEEFFKREPDLIWFPHPDYTKITSLLLDSQEFWENYTFYPGAFDYGIAVKRTSPHLQQIYNVLERLWHKNYGDIDIAEYIARPITNKTE